MKKNPLLEKLRREMPEDIKREVDLSFEISDRINEILKQQNLTQRDLALKLGKSETEISKWMRGTHNFTIRTIARIETALGEPILGLSQQKKNVQAQFFFIPVQNACYFTPQPTGSTQKRNKIKHWNSL